MEPGRIVLVDTNIIIEAVRTRCWSAVRAHFSVATVDRCCEEARTGQRHRPGYVPIEEADLRERLASHAVGKEELVALVLADAEAFRLDIGERELWAHALGRGDAWLASCCDRAAVNAAVRLGWEDRLVSLEELAETAGSKRAAQAMKDQFSRRRLAEWRTAALLKRGLA